MQVVSKTGQVNVPKVVLFCSSVAVSVGYCYYLLPGIWQSADLSAVFKIAVCFSAAFLMFIPIVNAVLVAWFAYYVQDLGQFGVFCALAPMIVIMLFICLYAGRLVADSQID